MQEQGININTSLLPRAVIFDMDGVLADTEPLHAECYIETFRRLGIEITLEEYRLAVPMGGLSVQDYYFSLGGDSASWETVKKIKDRMLDDIIRERISPMPGVLNLLRILHDAEIPTAVATSARQIPLQLIMDTLELWEHFDCFVSKDDTGIEKPDPSLFLLAAEKLGCPAAHCVAIEDSPRGVMAAYRAGMKCIVVPTDMTYDGDFSLATMVVDSLEHVDLEVLRGLFNA